MHSIERIPQLIAPRPRPFPRRRWTFACAGSALIALSLFQRSARADDSAITADAIAAKVVRSDTLNWDGARTRVRMVLIEPGGEKRERALEVVARRQQGLLQSLIRFSAPADIAGTAFLMLERSREQTEQYIYLAGLKRTRRIVGREREGSFMGSDFTYSDMQRVEDRYAKHKRLPDEKIGNDVVFVLESTLSANAPVTYSKLVSFIRKSDYVALRTRFYDRSEKLVKTLYTRRVRDIDGKPVVVEARMQSQNNHATDLFIDAIERRSDLGDSYFTPAALEHM